MIGWFILVFVALLSFYAYLSKDFNYWAKRKIPFEKPILIFGNLWPLVSRKMSLGEYVRSVYEKHPNEKYVGLFLGGSPCLVVRDFELARNILNRDVDNFNIRIVHFDRKREPVPSKTLFSLGAPEWKPARQSMTPAFTTLKLKQYFNDMIPIVKDLYERIEKNRTQDIMQMTWCFTVDAINRPLYGLNSKAVLQPSDQLLEISKDLYKTDPMTVLAKFCMFAAPSIYSTFGMNAFPPKTVAVITKIASEILKGIDNGSVNNKNVMSHLHALFNKDTDKSKQDKFEFDKDAVAAQVFALLVAGTDTLSSTMTYCLYELAINQDIQERLREEVLRECPDGLESMTYEKVTAIKYLHSIIMETSRLHPSFPFVDRTCTKDYTIPGTNTVINKGVFVFVAMWGLHMDNNYWETPEVFNPDRFMDMTDINSKPFLPFGNGIRTCIGMKFAIHEIQLFLASIVAKYKWTLAPGSKPLRCNPLLYTNLPDAPINIILTPLKK